MNELEKKLKEGIPKAFAGLGISKRFNEKKDELISAFINLYKILVYIMEGREVE